jgi:hypothetical protein
MTKALLFVLALTGGTDMTNSVSLDILAVCAAFAMVTAVIVGAW